MNLIKNLLESINIYDLKKDVTIKYSYGTAGFRYHNKIIINDLAFSIGELLGYINFYFDMTLGLMITASHNPIEDNGVKIIGENGEMVGEEIEELITLYCNGKKSFKRAIINEMKYLSESKMEMKMEMDERKKIVIGVDSRPSSSKIFELIEDGLYSAFPFIEIDLLGEVSTPIVHYHMIYPNQYLINIPFYFKKWMNDDECEDTVLVDCANGIGGYAFSLIYSQLKNNIHCNLRNIGETDLEKQYLNHECGSEYVQKDRKIPISFSAEFDHSHRIAHFDGDGDRLVYTKIDKNSGKYHLLDGDKIGVLMTLFIQKELEILIDFEEENKTRIGFIQTAYANGASTKFVKNKLKVKTRYAATGVKNLHHIAKEYDIGVYFEANGHGTVLFSKEWLLRLDDYFRRLCMKRNDMEIHIFLNRINAVNNIYYLSKLINQGTGDAITNLLVIEGILKKTGLTIDNWIGLYGEKPNKLWKMNVEDKLIFKACEDETRLLEPQYFQEEIDKIVESYLGARCFVRPSGTENCVRIYCEAENDDSVEEIYGKVNKLFKELNGDDI